MRSLSLNLAGKAPDFICIGAQKAGTEWLYDQLSGHKGVWLPPIRELHYFDNPDRFCRKFDVSTLCAPWFIRRLARNNRLPPSIQDLGFYFAGRSIRKSKVVSPENYRKLFCADPSLITGEITPAYSTLEDSAIKLIRMHFPGVRIIFLVRNPIDRFWSQLCMEIRKGRLDEAITLEPSAILKLANSPEFRLRSFPSETYEKWRTHFNSNQLGVFLFDHLQEDPLESRDKIFNFLSLDPAACHASANTNRKAGHVKVVMSANVRTALFDLFSQELQKCESYFGERCGRWLNDQN